ncbi:hypothetical protein [Haoranjiania flava]
MNFKYLLLFLVVSAFATSASAQKKKKKDKIELTELQLAQIHASYKKVFQDSLGFASAVADSVARIEKDFMLKKRNVMLNKEIPEDEKAIHYGMLDSDRDAILGSFLSIYDLDRFRAFIHRSEARQKQQR